MNTCPTCQNALVCHDQGECLRRPTPETDSAFEEFRETCDLSNLEKEMANIERERNEAHELLASEKSTRNAIIAKGIETERQLAEARQKLEIAMAANSDVERIAKERNDAQKAFAIATSQLVQVQGELRQARELVARLRQDLDDPPADVQERVLAKLRSAYANLNTLP